MTTKRRTPRVVIAKVGLDGHTRGARMVAWTLRDAGMEVVYTGTRLSPDEVVNTVLQEDAGILGISLLSGAHMEVFPRVLELLKQRGLSDVIVLGGGIIAPEEATELKRLGVAEIFPPGTKLDTIARTTWDLWQEKHGSER